MEKINITEETPQPARKKSNGRIVLTSVVALLALAAVSFYFIFQFFMAASHARYMGIMNVSSENFSKLIRGAELSANNIFDEVNNHLESPEDVIAALRSKANLNLDVRGYFAAFEPGFFPEKGAWFEPYIYQPEYGGFEYRQVGSARHNYMKSPWYVRAKESSSSFWSDPYYYYDATSMSGHYASFVKPIYDAKGNLACVCGADIKLEWLMKELEWTDVNSKTNKYLNKYLSLADVNFYTVLMNDDGTSLVAPDEKTVTITDKKVLKDIAQRKDGVAEQVIDGTSSFIFYGPVDSINWSVAVIVPQKDIWLSLLPIAVILLSVVVGGIFLIWFVSIKR